MREKLHNSWIDYFYWNEEINTDEILIDNFIHDRLRRNYIYLHLIEYRQNKD